MSKQSNPFRAARKDGKPHFTVSVGSWVHEVLKVNHTPGSKSGYETAFCRVKSQYTPAGELGDVYQNTIPSFNKEYNKAVASLGQQMDDTTSKKMSTLEGRKIQSADLQSWFPRLSTECYIALEAECVRQNLALTDKNTGEGVFRGNAMTEFVCNWRPT